MWMIFNPVKACFGTGGYIFLNIIKFSFPVNRYFNNLFCNQSV